MGNFKRTWNRKVFIRLARHTHNRWSVTIRKIGGELKYWFISKKAAGSFYAANKG